MFVNFFYVGAGGFIGAILRYIIFLSCHDLTNKHGFPYGTLIVNSVGSLIIGVLVSLSLKFNFLEKNSLSSLFIITGVLGAFTTFSAFSNDNFIFFIERNYAMLFLNVFLNTFLGLTLVALGYFSISKIF